MSEPATLRRMIPPLLVLSALGMNLPASAQAPTDDAVGLGEVVVTGSRIVRPDLQSTSPLTVVDERFFRQKGSANVEEVLNQLPQIQPGLVAQVNNGGDGTATVDLRALGASRTLVLINGRRFVPATNTGRVDLNAIPAHLIKRVEVVTGGASAVYGSDALAGVVNFVLRDDYEGVELTARHGETTRGEAGTTDFDLLIGGNFNEGRGNAVVGASYSERRPVFLGARDWSRIDQAGGSATGPAGSLDVDPFNPFASGGSRVFNVDRSVRPFINQLPELNGGVGDRYNFAPVNYLQTPNQRYAINGSTHLDVGPVQLYSELYYVQNRATLNLASTPATGLTLPVTNPLLANDASFQALAAGRPDPGKPLIFRRRLLEFGPRTQDIRFDTTQAVVGARGALPVGDWKWDAYYSFGRTDESVDVRGDVSRERLNASLAGCPAGTGVAGCRVVDFFGPGKIGADDVRFLRIASAVDQFGFDRHLAQATLTGSLLDLPAGRIGTAAGVEYRKDASAFTPSESAQRGDFTGFNAQQPIAGSFDVKEGFVEVRVPVLRDLPLVRALTIDGAARSSDYSSVGRRTTWQGGLEWKPFGDLTVRGTVARATRAPSVFELFEAGDSSFPTATDPCALRRANGRPQYGGTSANPAPVPAAIARVCQLSGLPGNGTYAAQANAQVQASLIGNAALDAETGKTITGGLVWQPSFVDDFSTTFDYYSIEVDGYVARLAGGAAGQIDACFGSGVTTAAQYAANPSCANITRSASGELLVAEPQVNSGVLKTSGFDLALNYALPLERIRLPAAAGRVTARLDVNYLKNWTLDGEDFARQTSSDFGTLPRLRGNLRLTYAVADFSASVNWQYIGASDERPGDGGDAHVRAYSYLDASASYALPWGVEITAGAANLTDKQPPLILTGFTASNTDNSSYDGLGRRYFVSLTSRF
jgi:outer membrane receptor protein involved in Fe transport